MNDRELIILDIAARLLAAQDDDLMPDDAVSNSLNMARRLVEKWQEQYPDAKLTRR